MNIEVKNLNKSFSDFNLNNININIPKGKIVGLIGENGAGKTTLIKCIMDTIHKDSGIINIDGHSFTSKDKDSIGIIFDDSFFIETFRIKDINLICKNIYKKWDEELFYNYMKEFKIPKDKKFKLLSTGMKKKVEIACALSHHPKILILDEPTSGLDPIIRSEVLDIFTDFVKSQENSILLSTHITSDLEHIADDVIFISNGNIIFDKPLREVKENYIVLEVKKDDFKKINKKDIMKYKENRLDYEILIERKKMKKNYQKYAKNITTLDDIMLIVIRGVACED
ncbi:MAG: ABC transporter ATP-binding protein [Bacilli bacterium]|nr:ABC transporter ATP-binding protein [Bacilli bacterium]